MADTERIKESKKHEATLIIVRLGISFGTDLSSNFYEDNYKIIIVVTISA